MSTKRNYKLHIIIVLIGLMFAVVATSYSMAATDPEGGWVHSKNGKWWYRYSDGTYPVSDWAKIDGKWYHFDSKGWMQTGWIRDNNNWYYLNKNGTMKTGWVKYRNQWYYLKTDGTMRTGWQKYKDNWYFFNKDGVMQTGRVLVRGEEFFMDSDGACINTDEDITFVKTDTGAYRKYYKGIRTSDFMSFHSNGSFYIQNELTADALHSLKLDNAEKYLDALDQANAKEGFERTTDPHIFNYIFSERFPVIYGVVYQKNVPDESGIGGEAYIRVYRLDTGELYKEYKDLLKYDE